MDKEKVKKILKKSVEKDQNVRKELSEKGESKKLLAKMNDIDLKNNKVIKDIVAKYGLISISEFGEEASRNAFLLVQHMPKEDIEYMEKYLEKIRKDMEDINPEHFALLQDRTLVYRNKSQIYGTQLTVDDKTGKLKPRDVMDPKNLNKRRQELGLESIEEYLSDTL